MSSDIELEDVLSEREDDEAGPVEYEIASYPADFTLRGLYQKWAAEQILLPPFQRQFVWTMNQSSKLIESFLLGLPVPEIFLYKERSTQRLLVIDGQQRLLSACFFFKGIFANDKVFRLQGLRTRWNGRTYEELTDPDRLRIDDSVLRAIVVSQIDPKDDTSIYHVFERLNTGGTKLSNQEVRNCVYWGSFNERMKQLNNDPNWRAILGKPRSDSRQRDLELMLRFFALLYRGTAYRKPMKDFLSQFMSINRSPSQERLEEFATTFKRTCEKIIETLGGRPFHIRAGMNSSVFDAVSVAFASCGESLPTDVAGRYTQLIKDQAFLALVTSSTTDDETVLGRLALAKTALCGA